MVEIEADPSKEKSDKALGSPDVLLLLALFAAVGEFGSVHGATVSWRDSPAEIP